MVKPHLLVIGVWLAGALCFFGAPAGAADASNQVDVWVNVTMGGLTQMQLNVSGLNITLLLARLKELSTSSVPEYKLLADAYLNAITTQLDSSTVGASACTYGSYTDPVFQVCVPCMAGKYSGTDRASSPTACTNCAMGTYSTTSGASSVSTCLSCPTGTYSGVSGANNASLCQACQSGATTVAGGSQGADACTCKDGYYKSTEFQTCLPCSSGRYCSNNAATECPQMTSGASTSLMGSSTVDDCYCMPGYYGRPLGTGTTCVECKVGTYCPGDLVAGVAQKYVCPDKSTTALAQATSVDDCVCEASYKKRLADPAVRGYRVDAMPCACSVQQACESVNPSGCGCPNNEVCSTTLVEPRELSCAQGYVNLVAANTYISTSSGWSWLIAPADARTNGVTLSFSLFSVAAGDKLKIWRCVNKTSCPSSASQPMYEIGSESNNIPPLVSSGQGYSALKMAWSASGSGTGWKATYGSTLSCDLTSIAMTLTEVTYSSSKQVIQLVTQVPVSWPIVVWVGDTLSLTVPASFVNVDIRNEAGASALTMAGISSWSASTAGAYSLVDPSLASTRFRKLMVMPSDPTTLRVYYLMTSGTPSSMTLSGSTAGIYSPDIVMTVGDTLVMSRLTDGPGVVVLSSYTSPSVYTLAKGVVGQSTSSVAMASLTWDTTGSAAGLYYYASAGSIGGTKMGRILLIARPGGAQCVLCSVGEYCYNGNPLRCPANSNSPLGSVGIENCTCSAGFSRETTDMATYVNSHTTDSGGRHSCVVTEGGGLTCWGANEAFQLGLGRASTWEPPTAVDITGVWNVSLGDNFTCVVMGASKKTRCWGSNYYGQLGLDSPVYTSGGTFPKLQADAMLGGGSTSYETLQLSCALHSCCAVILVSGGRSLTCWGRGETAQLGRGGGAAAAFRGCIGTGMSSSFSITDPLRASFANMGSTESTPLFSVSGYTLMVTMGGFHACALRQEGSWAVTYCWGLNKFGALGMGSASEAMFSPAAVSLGKPSVASSYAKTVSCYNFVCCAVMSVTFQVKCWGMGSGGRLGNGVFDVGRTAESMGVNLQSVLLKANTYAMDVNVGEVQTCVLLGNNYVQCWGLVAGDLKGDNPPLDMQEYLPSLQLTGGRVAIQIGGNGAVTCAVLSDYRVVCWGNNDYKQLGGALVANLVGSGSSVLLASSVNMTIVNLTAGTEAMRSTGVPTALVCSMCPDNSYCPGGVVLTQKCPAFTTSPAQSSVASSCSCVQGYAVLTGGSSACQQCSGTQYCIGGGSAATCPTQSLTVAAGSFDLSQCACRPGYTGANGADCAACVVGTYKDTQGSAACTQCPAGTFNAVTGLNSSAGCEQCRGGTFSAAGAYVCTGCSPGTAAKVGSSSCVTCTAGFYSSLTSDGCVPCPAGTYDEPQYSGAADTCTSCSPGYASAALNATNSSTCKKCPAGTRALAGSAVCSPCDRGQYSREAVPSCDQCPANSDSLEGSSYAKCTCLAGFYKKFENDQVTFTCDQCPVGKWAAANATSCTLCPNGTASSALGATSADTCAVCNAGLFAPAGSAACGTCPSWSFSLAGKGACTNCSLGQFSAASSSSCQSCSPGKFSDKPSENAGGCLACPQGYFCLGFVVAGSTAQVQSCPTGTYAKPSDSGYTQQSQCLLCPAKSYCPRPTLISSCPDGTESPEASSSQLQCACKPGFVCQYTKVLNAVITLKMSAFQFGNALVQAEFLKAVAYASNAKEGSVKIIQYVDSNTGIVTIGGASRRLLGVEGARGGHLHVFLEVSGGGSDDIVNLDRHLAAAGLAPSVNHAWYAPHAVSVQRQGETV